METLMGPIQLVVIGFPKDAPFTGKIRQAFEEVRGRGVIRVIDALFVRKDETGKSNAYMRGSDFTQQERMAMGALVGGLLGLRAGGEETAAQGAELAANAIADGAFGFGLGDLQNIDEQIEPGQAAL